MALSKSGAFRSRAGHRTRLISAAGFLRFPVTTQTSTSRFGFILADAEIAIETMEPKAEVWMMENLLAHVQAGR